MLRKFFVYLHRRATDGIVFYVGKGCRYRHKSKWNRSKHWHNTVNKHGLLIETVQDNLDETEAFALEIELIEKYKSDKLCNRTVGGEGASGMVVSEETKAKHKALRWTSEWRNNLSQKAKERHKDPDFVLKIKAIRKIAMNRPEVKEKLRHRHKEQFAIPGAKEAAAERTRAYFESAEAREHARKKALARFDSPEKRAAHAQAKAIKCVETGVVFGTGTLAAEWVSTLIGKKADNSSIAKAARKGKTSYGYHWEYLSFSREVQE